VSVSAEKTAGGKIDPLKKQRDPFRHSKVHKGLFRKAGQKGALGEICVTVPQKVERDYRLKLAGIISGKIDLFEQLLLDIQGYGRHGGFSFLFSQL
jgi:hypothetical protein